MNKEVILTGIRANNDLHIGNYFGALLPIIDMAKNRSSEYQVNLFIPDLHSFTTPIDHSQLQAQIMHNLKIFAAAGLPLDSTNIRIYRQSYIPAHSELTWILDCFTSFGEMRRMTQFKEKSQARVTSSVDGKTYVASNKDLGHDLESDVVNVNVEPDDLPYFYLNASVGLFNYPVLMASDILLYRAKYVPVGDDQTQHLEFTRNIAERMNKQFGNLFLIPEPVSKQHEFFGKDQGLRIKDLVDPSKKMSKSEVSDAGVIFLGDQPDKAVAKIKSAKTDSYTDGVKLSPEERPGVYNLVQIFELLKPGSQDKALSSSSYIELKLLVADAVKEFLTDFQSKLAGVDEAKLMQKLESDEKAMNEIANETLLKVQKAVGLRPK